MKGDTNNLNINKKIYFDSEFIKILNNLHKNVEIKKIIFFLINLLKFDIIECRLKYNGDMFDFNTIC